MVHAGCAWFPEINRPVACKGSRMQLFLIAVTSRLDAVVACINVLHPMEKQGCVAF